MWWRRMVLAGAMTVAACSGSGSDPAPRADHITSTAKVPDAASAEDVALLGRYAAALDRGDTDAAMALRCPTARIMANDRAVFDAQLERFRAAVGTIRLTDIRKNLPTVGLRPKAKGADAVELTFATAYGRPVGTRRTIVVAIGAPGQRTLCGSVSSNRKKVIAALAKRPIADLGPSKTAVRDLMPSLDAPGYHQVADGSVPTGTYPGEVEGWRRSWQYRDYGGANVFAVRFRTPAAASNAASRLVGDATPDATALFDPGIEGAVGIRIMADAWLWVQSPAVGPYLDRIVVRLDDVVLLVQNAGDQVGDGHEPTVRLAADTVARAEL